MNSMLRSGQGNAAGEASPTVAAKKVSGKKKVDGRVPAAEEARKGAKPFSMSYGGRTMAEYIQYRFDRGAR